MHRWHGWCMMEGHEDRPQSTRRIPLAQRSERWRREALLPARRRPPRRPGACRCPWRMGALLGPLGEGGAMTPRYYEALVGADLIGTPQAPRETELIRSDGRQFPTFFNRLGGKIPVGVILEREISEGDYLDRTRSDRLSAEQLETFVALWERVIEHCAERYRPTMEAERRLLWEDQIAVERTRLRARRLLSDLRRCVDPEDGEGSGAELLQRIDDLREALR